MSPYVRAVASMALLGSAAAAKSAEFKQFGSVCLHRDDAFGVPLALDCDGSHPDLSATSLGDTFEAIGYAQAEDRLFQLFLRLSAANGRLSEFAGAGEMDLNIEADKATWRKMMSSDELMQQFSGVMDEDTQLIYTSFVRGLQRRVDEVNDSTMGPSESSLLPYEFTVYDLDTVPADLFTLESILQYSLSTMRRLCDGCDPTYQLDNLNVITTLATTLGSEEAAMAAFNDVSTQQGFFELENTVVDGRKEPQPHSTRFTQIPSRLPINMGKNTIDFILDAKAGMDRVESHLRGLGAISADGSWAIVDGSQQGESFGQYGPQDPNTFPTTFYEMFIDTKVRVCVWGGEVQS